LTQLALPLTLQDHAVFETFHAVGNETLVAFLRDMCAADSVPGVWIRGAPSTGKTHLLQAVCDQVADNAQYVPVKLFSDSGSDILAGLASKRFVCLDDIDAVCGISEWEHALFTLINELHDVGSTLCVSASTSVRESGIALDDLQSRFSKLPQFAIQPLAEPERMDALQLRARHRGLELPRETASYLLTRQSRDMTSLYALLDRLDGAALQAQRKLTVPFVKEVLKSS